MDRLSGVAELLDGPLDDPVSLDANLRDLARINRLTGGTRLSVLAIAALDGSDAALGGGDAAHGGSGPRPSSRSNARSILDVGTGGADIPMALLARARAAGDHLEVTATDSRPEILAAAERVRPAIRRAAGLTLAIADGRSLPYPDGAFDVAHASLVVHHLEPDDAVAFLRELRRVARDGIVVNDLVRGRLAWIGGWLLLHAVARSPYTRHDGPLSVRRAYTRAELGELIATAGLETVVTVVGPAGHRVALAAR